jgi:hypothetical protein
MAVTSSITLDGVQLSIVLPIAYGYERITGDDSRNLAADLQITHRGWRRRFSIVDNFADEATKTAWEALALNVGSMPYISETGQSFNVVVRSWRPELILTTASEPRWVLTMELEQV